jgi:hypothetical protein
MFFVPEKVGVGREFKYGKVTCAPKCPVSLERAI